MVESYSSPWEGGELISSYARGVQRRDHLLNAPRFQQITNQKAYCDDGDGSIDIAEAVDCLFARQR